MGPHSPHESPRGLGQNSHLIFTRFPELQALLNEMVETTETERFLKNDAFRGVLRSKIGPASTPSPPTWVQTSDGVHQLTHFCVFLP
jgi:hypothetical protein